MKTKRAITLIVVGLTIFGLLMVGSASSITAKRDFGDQWYYLKLQSSWAVVGLIGFLVAGRLSLSRLEKLSPFLLILTLIFLACVLIPGLGLKIQGARRWLNLGLFSFQPAELAKLTLVLYLSRLFKIHPVRPFPFLAIIGAIGFLVILEPDLGTTLVLTAMGLATYFGSGGRISHLLAMFAVLVLSTFLLIATSSYRRARLRTFFDFAHDPQGASYQVRQAVLGLGSGGIFGRGLGESRQKYEFLPEVTTDSIFAVIGEELGLVGGVTTIIAFSLLVHLGFKLASNPDPFASHLAVGITSWIGIQASINISSQVALTPLTGIPLPFISYGGSSLIVSLFAMGLLGNIAKTSAHD